MIPKKREDYLFHEGGGSPFDRREARLEPKTDAERNRMEVIELDDLNEEGKGPVNFSRKAGRTLDSFEDYWAPHDESEEYDIE